MDAELFVDVAHVGLDRARGDEQLAGNIPCGQVAREVAKDSKLALAERLGATLVTADARLARATGPRCEMVLVGACGDEPAG